MAELVPAPFPDLVTRLHLEPERQDRLFELPRRSWHLPPADGLNLGVHFHGLHAGNPSGPAAGPHTQMAQNLLLSYAAGARILELKTVQIDDRLTISRPCIDMTNVGYNVEWSQELLVAESLREYVAGSMLIEMFRRSEALTGGQLTGPAGDVIYDLSVGYDLAGIRSAKVCGFLNGMRDATADVARLREQIPRRFSAARDLAYPTRLASSVTLSTFHGCPADEIEKISEFLLSEHDLDVVVKMNPPTLGKERLEHLLHDVLGYAELSVNPTAYTSVVPFAESVELCHRLRGFARARGRQVGFKFSNTLEVVNHRDFFASGNPVMYLSGQPLHVITMALTDEFRRAVGPDVPISFSAGVDQHNFALMAACGFVPITASTDLLRPGGYGRLSKYLDALASEMRAVGARNIDEFALRKFGHEDAARRAAMNAHEPPSDAALRAAVADGAGIDQLAVVRWAGLLNTTVAAKLAADDPRYRAARNRAVPRRIDSHLNTFDCITCDKCLPVCPNSANFTYPVPTVEFECRDLVVTPAGETRDGERRRFAIEQPMQIACYADFCNECGNCDTFCPEYGGPYIKKPTFFGSVESWDRAAPRDGFVVHQDADGAWIRGRIQGKAFRLETEPTGAEHRFTDDHVSANLADGGQRLISLSIHTPLAGDHVLDMWAFHVMTHLLRGVTDRSRINQVNARFA